MQKPLNVLNIRTGVVRNSDVGYILACDAEMEENEIPHTYTFTWRSGRFERGSLNFNAHTCCVVSVPGPAKVMLDSFGGYGVVTPNERYGGNIFEEQPKQLRRGAFRMVGEISCKAYAVGLRGIVYRLEDFVKWMAINTGLPTSVNINAIDGFDAGDIYVTGNSGAIWHYDGRKWRNCDSPTNMNFNSVKCAGDGNVYVAGYDGCLLCGRGNKWELLAADETIENFWDLEWFNGELYLSTISFVYRLKDRGLELVDFGEDTPDTCYQLSAANGVMWSVGAKDIMMFDGQEWSRIF